MSRNVWAAGSDRVGHSLPANRKAAARCGVRPWLERFDWPIVRRCADCARLETEAPIAA